MATSLELGTAFHFGLDGDQVDVLDAPTIDVHIRSDGPITPFDDHFGFNEVVVTGSTTLNQHITVQFVDPDGDGRITQDERNHTALYDLVVVEYAAEDDQAVDVTLNLDSDLIAGTRRDNCSYRSNLDRWTSRALFRAVHPRVNWRPLSGFSSPTR